MKHAAVVLRQAPFNTCRNAEALRMTVGLTLGETTIAVIFRDDAVYALLPTQPGLIGSLEIDKHLETLQLLHVRLIAEQESLSRRHLSHLKWEVEHLTQREVAHLLAESDAIICY